MIDGERTPPTPSLRREGPRLHAHRLRACSGCALSVRRAVLLSGSVETHGREPTIPLADLARALEARLEVIPHRRVYDLYVGRCHWCILEPARHAVDGDPLPPPPTPPRRGGGRSMTRITRKDLP